MNTLKQEYKLKKINHSIEEIEKYRELFFERLKKLLQKYS